MDKYMCNKVYKLLTLSALPFTLAAMLVEPAQAVQITLDNFGSSAIVESFEGLSPRANLILLDDSGIFYPGELFTFESGVTLTESELILGEGVTIDNFNSFRITVNDFSIGVASFGLGPTGVVDSAADVPDGSAYLAFSSHSTSALNFSTFGFTFPSDMLRVGGLITSASSFSLPITLSAFDASGTLLETVSIPNVPVSDWASNFLGIENTAGIRRVTFSSPPSDFTPLNLTTRFTVLDKLTFERISNPSIAVPEPTSALGVLVGTTLAASCMLKRRQHNLK
jgi:hypothetical protein